MSYDFIDDDARPDNYTYGHEKHDPSWWGLSNHEEGTDTDWDEVVENVRDAVQDVPGMEGLIDEAEAVAGSYRDHGFECSVCGLRHGHSSDKHDVRDFFAVTDEFVEKMQYTPYCHCGVHELARLLNYYKSIEIQVFENEDEGDFDIDEMKRKVKSAAGSAPIPDRVRSQLNEQLGHA